MISKGAGTLLSKTRRSSLHLLRNSLQSSQPRPAAAMSASSVSWCFASVQSSFPSRVNSRPKSIDLHTSQSIFVVAEGEKLAGCAEVEVADSSIES